MCDDFSPGVPSQWRPVWHQCDQWAGCHALHSSSYQSRMGDGQDLIFASTPTLDELDGKRPRNRWASLDRPNLCFPVERRHQAWAIQADLSGLCHPPRFSLIHRNSLPRIDQAAVESIVSWRKWPHWYSEADVSVDEPNVFERLKHEMYIRGGGVAIHIQRPADRVHLPTGCVPLSAAANAGRLLGQEVFVNEPLQCGSKLRERNHGCPCDEFRIALTPLSGYQVLLDQAYTLGRYRDGEGCAAATPFARPGRHGHVRCRLGEWQGAHLVELLPKLMIVLVVADHSIREFLAQVGTRLRRPATVSLPRRFAGLGRLTLPAVGQRGYRCDSRHQGYDRRWRSSHADRSVARSDTRARPRRGSTIGVRFAAERGPGSATGPAASRTLAS